MKTRMVLVVALLIAALFGAVVTQAQELPDPCLGLSAEDCEVINSAFGRALEVAENFTMDYAIDVNVTGLPDGDLTFNHSATGAVALDLMGDFPLSTSLLTENSFSTPEGSDEGPVAFAIVGGIMYIGVEGEWIGIDLVEVMSDPELGAELGIPTSPEDLEGLTEQLGGFDPAMFEGLGALAEVPGFLSYVRNGDTFEFTADVTALISSEEFMDVLEQAGEADESGMVAGLGMILPMVLEEATLQVNQRVNTELNIIDRIEFNLNATINGAMIDPNLEQPVIAAISFYVELSGVNSSPVEFTIPENVEMIDPSMAGGMLGG